MGIYYFFHDTSFQLNYKGGPLNEYEDEDASEEEVPIEDRFKTALREYCLEKRYPWDYDEDNSTLEFTATGNDRGDLTDGVHILLHIIKDVLFPLGISIEGNATCIVRYCELLSVGLLFIENDVAKLSIYENNWSMNTRAVEKVYHFTKDSYKEDLKEDKF
jgi:hypothetical protein